MSARNSLTLMLKSNLLIPYYYKPIGCVIFFITSIYCFFTSSDLFSQLKSETIYPPLSGLGDNFPIQPQQLTEQITFSVIVVGLLMVCFSRQKIEDLKTEQLRSNSWQWAILLGLVPVILSNFSIIVGMVNYAMLNCIFLLVVFAILFHSRCYLHLHKPNRNMVFSAVAKIVLIALLWTIALLLSGNIAFSVVPGWHTVVITTSAILFLTLKILTLSIATLLLINVTRNRE